MTEFGPRKSLKNIKSHLYLFFSDVFLSRHFQLLQIYAIDLCTHLNQAYISLEYLTPERRQHRYIILVLSVYLHY